MWFAAPGWLRSSRSVITASFIVDAAGYSLVALALPQMAPVARSSSRTLIDPGAPARYFSTAVIRCCMRQEKRGAIPVQAGWGVGLGSGAADAAAQAPTVTRTGAAKDHQAALRDPGNAMILPTREHSR